MSLDLLSDWLETVKLISAFVFATQIVQFLFFLNPKSQASSLLLCLFRLVCVRPGRKHKLLFSVHEASNNFCIQLGTSRESESLHQDVRQRGVP